MYLLITESPAKAKKIQGFLSSEYKVSSSCGHIRDLEKKKLSIDVDNNFRPVYKNLSDKREVIKNLKSLSKDRQVILAADDDREGEAIAWHCANVLGVPIQSKNRITYREISKQAILKALKETREINMCEVNAQQSRRIIDRLIGFKLSPCLWKHIQTKETGLSAGRVQSALLNLLAEREQHILNYEPEISLDITASFTDLDNDCEFIFSGEYEIDDEFIQLLFTIISRDRKFLVSNSTKTKDKSYPKKPFITSTLQQSAQNELGFPVGMTMDIAQKLYENGKITYMRTDSTFISNDFKESLKRYITNKFSLDYYRSHKSKKVKGAQEAHECIRPTDLSNILSDSYKECDKKLYNLIVKRTITSHMKPAIYDVDKIKLNNETTKDIGYFIGVTKSLSFEGFLKYSGKTIEKKNTFDIIKKCHLIDCEIKESESNPPQYYNESSIVKKLETSGIGRPSTYSSIVSTIYSRKYTITKDIEGKQKEEPYHKLDQNDNITKGIHKTNTIKQKKRIMLTDLGETVLDYLLKHFSNMICIDFTAQVENDLDLITNGKTDFLTIIKKVYDIFNPVIEKQLKIKRTGKNIHYIDDYEIKTGKFGPYVNISGKNYGINNYLEMTKKKLNELTKEDISILIQYPKIIGKHNKKDVSLHLGPYGIYMKYDNKNYRINQETLQSQEYSLSSLLLLIRT